MQREDRHSRHQRGKGGFPFKRGGRRHGFGRGRRSYTQEDDTNHTANWREQPVPVDPLRAAFQPYIVRWRSLVDLEQKEEQRLVRERLANWSLDRLRREGLVLMELALQQHGSFFGKLVIRARSPNRGPLPFNRFGLGDLVTICRRNPLSERVVEGTVMERSRTEIRLVCDQKPPGMDQGLWRLDQGVNTVVYDRMRAAVSALAKDPEVVMARKAEQAAAEASDDGRKRRRKGGGHMDEEDPLLTGPPGTWLREALLHAGQGCDLTPLHEGLKGVQAQSLITWLQQPHLAPPPGDPVARLNPSQRNAAALALSQRLTLLQGPPGTGKTSTIVRFIHMLKNRLQVGGSILACAQSNVAVDNLLEGLLECGVKAVRVGQPVKVRELLREHCLDARMEQHRLFAETEQMRGELRQLRHSLPSLRGRHRGLGHRDVSVLNKRLKDTKERLMNEVLGGAQVICSTCVGAGSDLLEGMDFPIVILDEGSQCCEPEALIPLVKGSRHAVLVGDHFQLPPVVKSPEAQQGGLDLSLFERLINGNVPSTMLQVQYRMHPSISEFPNRQFYRGQVQDGVRPQDRPTPSFPFPSSAHPVAFVESGGTEEVAHGGSKLNRVEAHLVQQVVKYILDSGEPPSSIGVITPYAAQLQVLIDGLGNIVDPAADGQEAGLEIKTVDGFQGREKEIIIFSTVRSNSNGEVGFLDDWRRMNVALTRARRGLIVLGNSETLRTSPHWAKYMQWLMDHQAGMHRVVL